MQKCRHRAAPKSPPTYPIASVDRALRLLQIVGRRRAIRVTEAGAVLGVAYSTAHRLLAMLEQHGFVRQEGPNRMYVIGPAFAQIGLVPHETSGLCALIRPALEDLVEHIDETTHFVVLEGSRMIHLEGVESSRFLRGPYHVGHAMPAHATSGGKVLLAAIGLERLRELYPRANLPQLTSATIAVRSRLEAQLALVQRQGYAVSFQEIEVDVHSVAVPVANRDGKVVGAFVVAGPATRMPAATCRKYAELLAAHAQRLAVSIPTNAFAHAGGS